MSLPSVSTGPQIQPKYKYLKNIQEKKKKKHQKNPKSKTWIHALAIIYIAFPWYLQLLTRSLVRCSPWVRKELDTTEPLNNNMACISY